MDPSSDTVLRLRSEIASLESVLADLKAQLTHAEAYHKQNGPTQLNDHSQTQDTSYIPIKPVKCSEKTFQSSVDQFDLRHHNQGRSQVLAPEEYKRYGRQLIMPEIGLRGAPGSLNLTIRLHLTPIESRPATTQKRVGPHRRCRRSRMSGCHISCWCWGGRNWADGRRHGRAFQPSPSITTHREVARSGKGG